MKLTEQDIILMYNVFVDSLSIVGPMGLMSREQRIELWQKIMSQQSVKLQDISEGRDIAHD
ncbi:MAG TPA: hypothetical protein VGK47_04535 [Nitrososphaeraceae archaeon]